jgi:hypothetical protein
LGIFYPGVPRDELKKIQEHFSAGVFVETGSYLGDTAKWASDFFPKVITIEADKKLFQGVQSRFAKDTIVNTLFGNSEVLLNEVVKTIKEPAMFWLDAHWSGPTTAGEESQCPLLKELEIINTFKDPGVILIDDARLFLAPPPRPHQVEHWPTITEVIGKLNERKDQLVYIWRDVIFSIPSRLKNPFQAIVQDLYEQKQNEENLISQIIM